jgi:hypothetical protein
VKKVGKSVSDLYYQEVKSDKPIAATKVSIPPALNVPFIIVQLHKKRDGVDLLRF